MMATLPTEEELPTPPAVTKAWFDPETGLPTPEFARYIRGLRVYLLDLRTFIEQEHP